MADKHWTARPGSMFTRLSAGPLLAIRMSLTSLKVATVQNEKLYEQRVSYNILAV